MTNILYASMLPFIQNIKNRIRVEHVIFAILILAIILRFAFLDLKLFHHDEAIHAWFSYQLLTTGNYLYDPVYHGPFFYYITASMFAIFGDSDLVGRILPCVAGCALIPLVYWLYRLRYLTGKVAVIAALFLAIAPELVYFSRFLRNDIFVVFFSLLLVVAFLAWLDKGKWYYLALASVAVALGMCSKENMPLILVTFGVFFLYLIWTRKITLPKKWIRDLIIAVVIFAGIICTLYSSFWTHPEMILQAGPLAIEHWIAMHNEQRIAGPPVFYLLMFILYELSILILAIAGIILFLRSGTKRSPDEPKEKFSFAALFRRPEAPASIDRKREFIRFAVYWTLIACLTYAYIGEKVPWLSLHQLVPMIFVAAFALTLTGKYWKILLAVSAVLLFATTCYVAYTPTDIAEPIIQVQNSEDLVPLMAAIDASDRVVIATNQAWPFMWYYRGDAWDKFTYYGALINESTMLAGDYDIIITHDDDSYDSLDGYTKETIRLNYWLDCPGTQEDPGWIAYFFTRAGKIGNYNFDVFTRTAS
ncbi:flippase activity-associated protein Agl23 [uncultured Methanocorpusculum sp.]|nr:flippase activity-associated protein Agl23 [uncultured Methanocorpusculum sp.]